MITFPLKILVYLHNYFPFVIKVILNYYVPLYIFTTWDLIRPHKYQNIS